MPKTFNRYIEPFLGGGAVFFDGDYSDAILADSNDELIHFYHFLAWGWGHEALVKQLDEFKAQHCKELFYQLRRELNSYPLYQDGKMLNSRRAAIFLYLNKTCFNGLWRVNQKGEMNTPFGSYQNPTIYDKDELALAHVKLANFSVEIYCQGYQETLLMAKTGDFVYLDPPYAPLTKTANFTGYTSRGFGYQEQIELAKQLVDLSERGVKFMLSNSDVLLIRELYKDFNIHEIKAPRNIAAKASSRAVVGELVITN